MTPEQFTLMMNTMTAQINESVKTTVNGKIDRISQKLDDYIISDNAWKDDAKPAIDTMKSVKLGGKVFASTIGVLAGLASIYQVVKLFIIFKLK